MTEDRIRLSRRKILAGAGAVGAAGVGAGLGTSALFSDEELFENNSIEAGELDLYVDYEFTADQGSASGNLAEPTSGTVQGDTDEVDGAEVSVNYDLEDVKPGDSGTLEFCPTIVDNPAWLWVGSDGVTDYENDRTEPEASVDDSGGDPGEGNGELSEAIQVTVSYCNEDGETLREMNNPDDYTLADLATELQGGFLLDGEDVDDGETDPYPASAEPGEQQGPCVCVEWEVPTEVGNEIQTDSVEFDVLFYAEQARHNDDAASPFVDETYTSEDVYVHRTSDLGFGNEQVAVSDINDETDSGASELEPVVIDVAYGNQVVFYVQPTLGMADPSNMGLGFDPEADGGAWDFQFLWESGGAGFTYLENGGISDDPANVSGVSASYNAGTNTFVVTVDSSRLDDGGDDFRFAMQSIHEPGASNNPLNPSGSNARVDAELPSGFDWGETSTWQDATLP